MRNADATRAASTIVERFEFASIDKDRELYQAFVHDEAFATACRLYQETVTHATHKDATEHDREAQKVLMRSIRDHAQRIRGEIDRDDQEGEADA